MSLLQEWQEKNALYLAAALAWLRLRLQLHVKLASEQWTPAGSSAGAHAVPIVADDQLAEGARAMMEAADINPPPALIILGQRLGLSQFEREVLLLCAAMELDTRLPALCARAHDHPNRTYPTFALAFTLFDDASWDAMSADRPLRYWRLIEINQPGATPLTLSPLRADERIVNYLKGLNQLDDRMAPLLAPFDVLGNGDLRLADSHCAIAAVVEEAIRATMAGNQPPVIQLTGIDSTSKQVVALEVFSRLGSQGFRLPGELLPTSAAELETLVRLWHRESTLLPLALFIDASEIEDGGRTLEGNPQINRFVARCRTLTIIDSREPRTGMGIHAPAFTIDKPSPLEQEVAWKEALADQAGENPGQLAAQFNLNLPAIRYIASSVLDKKQPDEPASSIAKRLWEACLSRTRPRLDRLAQRIEPKATWEELVLQGEPLNLLQDISAQVKRRSTVYDKWGFRRTMSRGFGISALFAGESGTGKTMAAEVIANELDLDLYRIDLSAVVSKYIGETEKNLRRVFDAAEDGGVILFFDEADALFGKRSQVKDSHDRYANIEVNYLLQRMEAFRGLAILASNMKSALDQAFLRRLRFIVNFPFPGAVERKLIWERAFPKNDAEHNLPGTPVEGLNYNRLSKLSLTGGSIHNVALSAAFLAARAGTPVTMELIFQAARTELRKLEKPVNEADLLSPKWAGANR